ncbi:MAG: RluA family pseudouridine synthase [Bacteroidales bacterium]|nr:RluA family pseudouridine synthase [Bacteroidales bacterium]
MQQKSAKNSKQFSIKVTDPMPLMDFLKEKLKGQSGTSIKSLLTHRCILLNHRQVLTQYNYPLKSGDEISIQSSKSSRYSLLHPKLNIVFEDDFIIAVEKKEGLLSVATAHERELTAYNILDNYLKRKDPKKRIFVVHRLDRETSGIMLFAKCREAQVKLKADWNDRVLERTYIAVAEGVFEPKEDTIVSYLYADDQTVMHSSQNEEDGLLAITHYKVLQSNGKVSLVQLNLETGRTNQIRVHLQSIGHSVIGDEKYGSHQNPVGRLCLHAKTIRFRHPVTQRILTFEMEVPHVFETLVR